LLRPLSASRICSSSKTFHISLTVDCYTAKTQCRKFETNIPRKGIAQGQSQFPHSCVCARLICSQYRSAYSAAGKYVDRDTLMWKWKLGLRPRNSVSGNTEMGFSLQCIQTDSVSRISMLCDYFEIFLLFLQFFFIVTKPENSTQVLNQTHFFVNSLELSSTTAVYLTTYHNSAHLY